MRILFLSDGWTVALCFVIWPVLQVSAALICLKIPDRLLRPQSILFRTYHFEKDGSIYDRIFHVSRWKRLLPDGGRVLDKKGFSKKHLEKISEEILNRFLVESARGELTHWLGIFPFWVFGFITSAPVIWYMLIYALLVNLPCIIAQRYNRPRVQKLLDKIKSRVKEV